MDVKKRKDFTPKKEGNFLISLFFSLFILQDKERLNSTMQQFDVF